MADTQDMTDSESTSSVPADNESSAQIKGFVFDIKKYAIHDGPGIRTTVFFKGCPLQCKWCHNPESWKAAPEHGLRPNRCIGCGQCVKVCPEQAISFVENHPVTDASKCNLCGRCVDACVAGAREIIGQQMSVSEVMTEVEKDIVFYNQSGGGVTFSGGEPLMQPEFLLALLNRCQEQQIHTTVDTSCYAERNIIEMISEKTDLFICDIKHIDSDIHERFTGVKNELILDNIEYLSKAGKKIVIRVPVVPGFNDDKANIEATGKFAASLGSVSKIDILAYNRGGNEKSTRLTSSVELMQTEIPNEQDLNNIAKNLSNYGFEVKIGG